MHLSYNTSYNISYNISYNTLFFYNSDVYNLKKFINNNYILLINYLINYDDYFLMSLLSQYMFKFK